jgi:WD40 repeat protein
MKLLHEQVIGGVVIAGLVAIGLLVAEEPEMSKWLDGPFLSRTASRQLSSITVSSVDWSADGRTLLCQSRGGANALQTLSIHQVSERTGYIPAWCNALAGSICHASLSPDGTSVVVSTHAGELWWVDLETWNATQLATQDHDFPILTTAIGHDGTLMAGGSGNGAVYLCHPIQSSTRTLSSGRQAAVMSLDFSANSQRLLCTRTDGSIALWDTFSGELLCELAGDEGPTAAKLLVDGNRILTSSNDDRIQIWDLVSRAIQWRGSHGSDRRHGVATMDVASSGDIAAWGGGMTHRIIVWDLLNQQKKFEITNPSVVLHVCFSPDASSLAVAGREGIVRIYDMNLGTEVQTIDVGRAVDGGHRI